MNKPERAKSIIEGAKGTGNFEYPASVVMQRECKPKELFNVPAISIICLFGGKE